MAPPNKLLVIESEDRVVGIEELGVEEHLDTVARPVEQLDPTNLVQDGVVGVVGHVVRRHGRERVAAEGKDATLEEDLVLVREEGRRVGDFGTVLSARGGRRQS